MNLYEMAREYRRNTALLELRVRELQAAKRRAGQYEVKYRLKQRIRVLNDMINESRLTVYELLRNSEFQTSFTNLVLEQVAERLDNFLEVNVIWKSSDIVVGFDHCRFSTETTLYNVRINGSLYKEINSTNLLCLFLEHTDELVTDDLSLSLRLLNAC